MNEVNENIEVEAENVETVEIQYFKALGALRDKEEAAERGVTGWSRLALRMAVLDKDEDGLPLLSIDKIKDDLGIAFGYKKTSKGKDSATLVNRAKQHYDSMAVVLRNLGTDGVMEAVTAFINSATPVKSTHNGLVAEVKALIAAERKAKGEANGTAKPKEEADNDSQGGTDAQGSTMSDSEKLKAIAAYLASLTADVVNANADVMADVLEAARAASKLAVAADMEAAA